MNQLEEWEISDMMEDENDPNNLHENALHYGKNSLQIARSIMLNVNTKAEDLKYLLEEQNFCLELFALGVFHPNSDENVYAVLRKMSVNSLYAENLLCYSRYASVDDLWEFTKNSNKVVVESAQRVLRDRGISFVGFPDEWFETSSLPEHKSESYIVTGFVEFSPGNYMWKFDNKFFINNQ